MKEISIGKPKGEHTAIGITWVMLNFKITGFKSATVGELVGFKVGTSVG
jgi:hypothetical protein